MNRLLLALLLALAACNRAAPPKPAPLRVGYMICNSREETLRRFGPLTAHLSQKLGVELEAVAIDTTDFTKEVQGLDFTHTNSLLYIILARNHGAQIVAAEKAGPLGARTQGAIMVRAKSEIATLADLRGKTMLFGPTLGPTSYLSQLDLLLKAGIDPDNDLASYSIPSGTFKHEKVVYGVLFGKADAGAVPMLDFEKMVRDGRIEREDFRTLAVGEPILYCNFAATQRVPNELARRFESALLGLRASDTVSVNGEVVRVLERAGVDGYQTVADQDFDGEREMARRTNMPPYQRY